ncbi:MAG: hypothetical protein RJA61_439 [Candidatus Parcubacteria bacterium]|jgi:hypothetical protein
MKREKIFKKYYESKLAEQEINNVVLVTYIHTKGLMMDDINNSRELIFTPLTEVDNRIKNIFSNTGEKRGISISSLISHKNEQKYLFLLDCKLPISDKNEKELVLSIHKSKHLLPALKNGMILRTQNSYHVVGFIPLSKEEWQKHMAYAILLRTNTDEDIADMRYIGHSLERGFGCLRVSDYEEKPTPDFVCYLN